MSLRTEKRARKDREEQYTLMDALPNFVWVRRPDGSIAYKNRRWHDYVHEMAEHGQEEKWIQPLPPAEQQCIEGLWPTAPRMGSASEETVWLQFVHPKDRERVLALQRQGVEGGEPYALDYRLQDGRTGAYRWFLSGGYLCAARRGRSSAGLAPAPISMIKNAPRKPCASARSA